MADVLLPRALPVFRWPGMFRHGWPEPFGACEPDCAMGLFLAPAVLAVLGELVAPAAPCALAACEREAAGDPLADALAMVRPRPRLAARTPAAIAVPASGREILIWSPLVVLFAAGAGRLRGAAAQLAARQIQ